jgi:nickel transport protein
MRKIYAYIIMVFLGISLAHAHRVNIFTQTQSDKVLCQCFYNDGKPVRGQDIQVKTVSGTVIAQGETDDEGMFSFTPHVHEDLQIVLNAGMGHMAETTVKKEDLPEIQKKTTIETPKQPTSVTKKLEIPKHDTHIDEERLREIVEQVVDEKLQQVTELIHQQQRSYSLTTIIGGRKRK